MWVVCLFVCFCFLFLSFIAHSPTLVPGGGARSGMQPRVPPSPQSSRVTLTLSGLLAKALDYDEVNRAEVRVSFPGGSPKASVLPQLCRR